MKHFSPIFSTLLLFPCFSVFAYTNILEHAVTQMVDTVWDIPDSNIVVGGSTTGSLLTIFGTGGRVTNATSRIGGGPAARKNTVSVEAGALWKMTEDIYIGDHGSDSLLEIFDGAHVLNNNAYVGAVPNSSNNTVRVYRNGRWENKGDLSLSGGLSNTVSVSDGGWISANGLQVNGENRFDLNAGGTLLLRSSFDAESTGFNWNEGGHLAISNGIFSGLMQTNGSMMLSGGRDLSLYRSELNTGETDLSIGSGGSGSFLVVRDGSTVTSRNGSIGVGADASNHTVYVIDEGSSWRNTGGLLEIGAGAGKGNTLTVSNKAWVYVGGITTNDLPSGTEEGGIAVGGIEAGTARVVLENQAYLETSGGLYLGSSSGNMKALLTVQSNSMLKVGSLDISEGSRLELGETAQLSIEGDLDYEANKQKLIWADRAELRIGGLLTKNGGLEGTGRRLSIAGNSARWTLPDDFVLSGSNNTVTVENGASMTNRHADIGGKAGISNSVEVFGAGANWKINGKLAIGSTATNGGNAVTVRNGGRVEADSLFIEEGNAFYLQNGGLLAMTRDFNVSSHTNLNWLRGGELSVQGRLSGMEISEILVMNATNDAVFLDGGRYLTLDGGEWLNSMIDRILGYNAGGSDLTITNGAQVSNVDGYIGWGRNVHQNSVLVSGVDSAWTNSGNLYVGAYWNPTNLVNTGNDGTPANNNKLTVENGAWVYVGDASTNELSSPTAGGMLVASSSINGGQLTVGSGTVHIEETLYLGVDTNTTGMAEIRNGGIVSAGDLVIIEGSRLELQGGGTFAIETSFDVADRLANGFEWNKGGHLSVGGTLENMTTVRIKGVDQAALTGGRDLTLLGSNALWNVGGELAIGMDGGGSVLTMDRGAIITNGQTFIGLESNAMNNSVTVNAGSYWQVNGDLHIGYASSNNNLLVSGYSTNYVTGNAYIGAADTAGNHAEIRGSNSLWAVDRELVIGGISNTASSYLLVRDYARVTVKEDLTLHSGNSLQLASAGIIEIAGNMNVFSNTAILGSGTNRFGAADSLLSFEGNGIDLDSNIVFDGGAGDNTVVFNKGMFLTEPAGSNRYVNFQSLRTTNTLFTGYGTVDSFSRIHLEGGSIEPAQIDGRNVVSRYGTLELHGSFTSSGTVYTAEVDRDAWDLLTFKGGAVSLKGLEARVFVLSAPTGLAATILSSETPFSSTNFAAAQVTDMLLLFDARLAVSSNHVDVVIEPNNQKFDSTLAYAGTESARAGFLGIKNSIFVRTRQMRRNLVAAEHSISPETYSAAQTNEPAMNRNSGNQNTLFDMHVWMQYLNGQSRYDVQSGTRGFVLNYNGVTFGADRLFGEALTLGFNYTYAQGSTQTPSRDHLDTETYWIGGYGEWVSENGLYIDALAAVGKSDYDSVRIEENYRGTASYNGYNFGAYADVGQYYHYKNLLLSPYFGLHTLFVRTASHKEENPMGEVTHVDDVSRSWIESALGLKARCRFDSHVGQFQTVGYAEWTHNFVQEDIYSTLSADGLEPVDMARIEPDIDVFNAGLGINWKCTGYMEIGVGYGGRFSKNFEEHSGSLMFRIMF